MNEPVKELLGLLQLERRARQAPSAESLAFVMVNETLQVLRYRQAALWRSDAALLGSGEVAAVSGLPKPNPDAPYTQWLTRLLRTVARLPQQEGPQSLSPNDFPEQQSEWAEWLPAHALWLPLRHGDGPSLGGLLLAADEPWQAHELAIASEVAGSYAHALTAFRRHKRVALGTLLSPLRRHRWLGLTVLVVAFFPVRQSVLAPAEVVPQEAFLVRAPQDGVVERMLVQPNQAVAAGAPLFALDQTLVHTRHAVARKAYDTAQEEYRQSAQIAVTDDKGKLDMSMRRGAMEEKSVELAYSAELLGRVQVSAERAGIAVFSDVNDWQGKTVVAGERILTLADPAKVELSIELPVGERYDTQLGAAVSLYPNASPLSAHEAVITQVAYSAEPTRDGQMAYRLKAAFPAGEAPPRIGLMGTARLHGSRVPLIYFALRRPMTTVRQWLGV